MHSEIIDAPSLWHATPKITQKNVHRFSQSHSTSAFRGKIEASGPTEDLWRRAYFDEF